MDGGGVRLGDPLNPITNSLYAKLREMPGFIRVSGRMARNPDPPFRGSREGYVLEKVLDGSE